MTVETRPIVVEPRTKTTADVLRHAAWIIEERGWCQYALERDGAVCAIGALNVAGTGNPMRSCPVGPYGALERTIGDAGVLGWNNAPGRTATEVTAALRAAADASERAS